MFMTGTAKLISIVWIGREILHCFQKFMGISSRIIRLAKKKQSKMSVNGADRLHYLVVFIFNLLYFLFVSFFVTSTAQSSRLFPGICLELLDQRKEDGKTKTLPVPNSVFVCQVTVAHLLIMQICPDRNLSIHILCLASKSHLLLSPHPGN